MGSIYGIFSYYWSVLLVGFIAGQKTHRPIEGKRLHRVSSSFIIIKTECNYT